MIKSYFLGAYRTNDDNNNNEEGAEERGTEWMYLHACVITYLTTAAEENFPFCIESNLNFIISREKSNENPLRHSLELNSAEDPVHPRIFIS